MKITVVRELTQHFEIADNPSDEALAHILEDIRMGVGRGSQPDSQEIGDLSERRYVVITGPDGTTFWHHRLNPATGTFEWSER
jgi:hypothetical protein